MTRLFLALIITGLLAASPRADGEASDENAARLRRGQAELALAAGWSFPSGDMRFSGIDFTPRSSFLVGAHVAYYLDPAFAIGAEFAYVPYRETDAPGLPADRYNLSLVDLVLFVKFTLAQDPGWVPYLRAGGGLARQKLSIPVAEGEGVNTAAHPAVLGAVGVHYAGASSVGCFAEAVLVAPFSADAPRHASVRAGILLLPAGETR
jgi:hypothetical protein